MFAAPSKKAGPAIHAVLLLALAFVMAEETRGERLPLKSYTLSDGLPHEMIRRIIQDTHGFIWFCTPGGISRFDGYRFTNYGMAEGLPSISINDLLETRQGVYWV